MKMTKMARNLSGLEFSASLRETEYSPGLAQPEATRKKDEEASIEIGTTVSIVRSKSLPREPSTAELAGEPRHRPTAAPCPIETASLKELGSSSGLACWAGLERAVEGLEHVDDSSSSWCREPTHSYGQSPIQEAPPNPPRFIGLSFAATLPPNWRPLTVDEEITLRPQLIPDMRHLIPGHRVSYGPVDRWLESGFDGTALLVELSEAPEIPADEAGIAQIRSRWDTYTSPTGDRRTVLSAHIIGLGADHHQAIECRIRSIPGDGGKAVEALEFYVPTGGHLLILSFRSWEDTFPEALTTFREMAGTLTFARPSQGPEELADRLLYAALIGVLIGLLLLAANRARRLRDK